MTGLVVLPVVLIVAAGERRGIAWLLVGGHVACLAWLLLLDLVALAGTVRAVRRLQRGLPPVRPRVDYGIGPDVWWRTVPAESPYRAQDRRELAAGGCPRLAAGALARNLLWRGALVLGFMTLAAALSMVCIHGYRPRNIGTTRTAANSIRSATVLYLATHPGSCPSVAALKTEGLLDRSFKAKDAWGNALELRCSEDDVVVHTNGPDRKAGTADDVVVSSARGVDADIPHQAAGFER